MKFRKAIPVLTKYFLAFFISSLLLLPSGFGQSRKSLEKKRKKLLKEISATSKLLNQTAKDRTATLDRFIALERQIEAREELLETLNAELEYANESLDRTNNVVFSLEEDLLRLEKEYGVIARNALRQKMNNGNLLFIFSSTDFNEALRRWQYLKQYNAYRKNQTSLILETQSSLKEKVAQLEERKEEKEALLFSTENQKKILAEELNSKSAMLEALEKDESRLRKDLDKKRIAHNTLNNAIEKVIKKEILASRKKERSKNEALKEANATSNTIAKPRPRRTPNTSVSSSSFNRNKGQLPWPVDNGVIIKRFGKQPHPTLKRVQITNNGIDIQTNANAQVQAVFEGTVVGKQFIPNNGIMLIIKHGTYYTVYANLKEVFVKQGDIIKTKQALGLASPKGNVSQVHFEIWKNQEKLNPASWIKRQ